MANKDNLSIRIFDKMYLGVRSSPGQVAHGYMVPYEDNYAGRNRMVQVDHWAKDKKRVILDNAPISGFKVSRAQRNAGWKNIITSIRMEDPRGFEVDITMTNLVMLTDCAVIQNGEILQECVWARDGSFNVLLPVNSAPYLEAKENTRRANSKVSTRTLNIGDTIQTDKAVIGVYMGYLHALTVSDRNASHSITDWQLKVEEKKNHILKITDEDGSVTYQAISSLKVSDIMSPATSKLTIRDSELEIANSNAKCISTGNRYSRRRTLSFVGSDDLQLSFKEVHTPFQDLKDSTQSISAWSNDHHRILYRSAAPIKTNIGEMTALPNKPYQVALTNFHYAITGASRYIRNRGYCTSNDFFMSPVDSKALSLGVISEDRSTSQFMEYVVSSTDTDNFFKIVATITTKNGVTFEADL